jgi:hypothetical protein
MCGYVYTEHMDIEWEYNGFMNYDRTVKDFGYDVRDINAADFIAIDHPPGKVYAPGERFRADLVSSHFSREPVRDAVLKWRVEIVGPDGESAIPEQREEPIAFPRYRVERVATVEFDVPEQRGLAHFVVEVEDGDGRTVARNCVAFEIYPGGLPSAEELEPGRWILRFHPASCTRADWDVEATPTGADDGHGEIVAGRAVGAFEYALQLPEQLAQGDIRDIGVCAELSAARPGVPQTDPDKHPSEVTVSVNGVPIATEVLENDPCDARGALSYIHGLSGEYGYLIGAGTGRRMEEAMRAGGAQGVLTVRFEVKEDATHRGGLSIYGSRAGRYPTDPCVVIEME